MRAAGGKPGRPGAPEDRKPGGSEALRPEKAPIEALLRPEASLSLTRKNGETVGRHGIELLEHIAEKGSLTQAAKAAGISYKTAWDAVARLNNLAEHPLVETATGGRKGGGAKLTRHGIRLLQVYAVMEMEHRKSLEALKAAGEDFERFYRLTNRIALRVSTRNQLWSRVKRVEERKLFAAVHLELKGGHPLEARLTRESIAEMGLKEGDEVFALFKATWAHLLPPGARTGKEPNIYAGKVGSLAEDEENTEVGVTLEGGPLVVALTPKAEAKALRLKPGLPIRVSIPPAGIILGLNH